MSVVGFDIGNETCIVAVSQKRSIDVVLNDESKRETPSVVSFNEKQRFLGTAASAAVTMNPKNTVSQIKRLIGKKFADPDVQRDLEMLPYEVTEGPDGSPLIHIRYLGEIQSFTPVQILGMVLSNLKSIATKNLGAKVSDCVMGVPAYFTDSQRRAYLDAAAIAGLHPLRLLHEMTATALSYGFYKTDLPETEPINVVFVDFGHSSMQVCVASFKKGHLKILAHSYDRSLGGRDFDEVLFNHFADKFKQEQNMNIRGNARASQRLRAACEKLKKVLSANPVAPLNIECLMDEKDVKGIMKRDDFEALAAPILNRVAGPCQAALAEANVTVDQIHSLEVVGSGSRVPSVLKILSSIFQKEPSRTLNASECIARGCALQCAMLSPSIRAREFEIQDSYPFPIALSWSVSASESEDNVQGQRSEVVFVKGNSIPCSKMLTFFRSSTFTIDAAYADQNDPTLRSNSKIGTFKIGPFQPGKSEKAKLKVQVRLNLHGIITAESATMIEEEEVEVPVTRSKEDGTKMETDDPPHSGNGTNVEVGGEPGEGAPGTTENGVAAEQKPATMEVDTTKETAKKKKTRKLDVPLVEIIEGALPSEDLQKAVEKEYEMALQDRVMEETKERKNAVEEYVYGMRNKLNDRYAEYATDVEKDNLVAKLQDTEDWLYEDGEDETKGVYIKKLEELKKLGDPIEVRYKEEEARGPAINELKYCIHSFHNAAITNDPKFDHIDSSDKENVINECRKADQWLQDKIKQQETLPKSANPVLLAGDIRKKAEALDRFCKPIMTKPRPRPATPTKAAAPPPEATKEGAAKTGNDAEKGDKSQTTEPMETDATQDGADTMQTD